jgi:N-acylglucosamine 2-epimerase
MLQDYLHRYRRELLDSVVPFWLNHSLDREHGGYFTCLDRTGAVYDSRKYVWLQGRAVWTFSRLYNEVERRPEWLAAAKLGVDFLRRHALDAEGRCYFSLTRDGRPAAFQRKPYGAVFLSAGLLEYAKASGSDERREEAVRLFWKILDWIRDPALLGRPLLPGQAPTSSLASVMVTMMLLLDIIPVDDDPRLPGLLDDSIAAAMRHLHPGRNVFLESVGLDGSFDAESPDGRFFNPGHSIEMAWFLLHALRRRPDARLQEQALDALASSLEAGWDGEHGGLFYFMDIEDRPMLPLESSMKLWWPHTEALYAVILAWSITRDPRWLQWLQRLDAYAFSHFADPTHGEWFGYCDRFGNVTNTCKGNHYKGFYHVPRFLLMSVQEISRIS